MLSYQRCITLKSMIKSRKSMLSWSIIFKSSSTTCRMTELNDFLKSNSSSITRSVVKLELSWVEESQLNSILSSSWDWVDFSQFELNLKSSWVAWTQFLKIVYLLICTEFSCKLNSNLISKNRIITCMYEIFAQTEFSRTLI